MLQYLFSPGTVIPRLFLWSLTQEFILPSLAQVADSANSGDWLILRCGAGTPNSNASDLQQLLPQWWDYLQLAETDVRLGTASTHGYEAMFKTNDSVPTVSSTLAGIANGGPITIGTGPLAAKRKPTLVCINAGDPDTAAVYHACMSDPRGAVFAGHWPNSEIIALCPEFWNLPDGPTLYDCPSRRFNQLTPNTATLTVNKFGVFMHQAVLLYNLTTIVGWPQEVYAAQSLVTLTATRALANANSYAFYACAIAAGPTGCTSFPNMTSYASSPQPTTARVLLEDTLTDTFPINDPRPIVPASALPQYQAAAKVIALDINLPPSAMLVPQGLATCNGAVIAPNGTVCCDEYTGKWIDATVHRDAPPPDPACTPRAGEVMVGPG